MLGNHIVSESGSIQEAAATLQEELMEKQAVHGSIQDEIARLQSRLRVVEAENMSVRSEDFEQNRIFATTNPDSEQGLAQCVAQPSCVIKHQAAFQTLSI